LEPVSCFVHLKNYLGRLIMCIRGVVMNMETKRFLGSYCGRIVVDFKPVHMSRGKGHYRMTC